mmetsp:Transcript_6266/g.17989  ORF Transcript_6266/g.17989 Transcript_6266/m.17989 type:complete len:496 (+) Transcript_6266:382-1869(+)
MRAFGCNGSDRSLRPLGEVSELCVLLLVHNVGVRQCDFLGAKQHIVGTLHTQHEGVILVGDLVLVRPEPTPRPDGVVPQPGQGLVQRPVTCHTGRGVAVLQPPVVEGHDLVGGGDELGVDGAPDGLRHNGRPGAARQLLRGLLHRLAVRLAHLEHERPVWSRLRLAVLHLRPISQQKGAQLLVLGGAVIGRVVAEHGGAVEGAVILRIIQPAFGVVGTEPANPQPDDVRRAVGELLGPVALAQPLEGEVQRHGRDEVVVLQHLAVCQSHCFGVLVQTGHLIVTTQTQALLRQLSGNRLPDAAGAALQGESKHCVGAPPRVLLVVQHVGDGPLHVHRGHPLPQPITLHVLGRHRPHLEIVGAHEEVSDSGAHDPQDPLIKVFWLLCGHLVGHLGVYEAREAADLVLFVQGADVVLEGVRHPASLDPHVAHPLQGVPLVWPGPHAGIQQLIEVLVVREDDVAAHVKQEALRSDVSARQATCLIHPIDEQPISFAMLV